jgi:uncharacterized repeat protein (TIGR03803 family)
LASAIALAAFAACVQAQTYNLRVIHRFSGAPDDGSSPITGVQFDSAGNLYGATDKGGTYNKGTVFKIAKSGTETILHSFDGKAGGLVPREVTVDPATGDLYGITEYGGEGDGNGDGLIYKVAADGTFTILHIFDAVHDGFYPSGRLVLDPQGNLYGSSAGGGGGGYGTVFEYGTNGTFTVLHAFTGADGAGPYGGVIRDRAGNLYGVTTTGGADNDGTIYRLAPDGTLTTLYTFTGGTDGENPYSLVGDQAGNLYGTTSTNWGTIFKLAPDGTFTTLYAFTLGVDGHMPSALLPIGGNLYGTSSDGGIDHDYGAVFKVAPDGTFTVLYSFEKRDGIRPDAPLTLKYGRLFGTTSDNVADTGRGTVFSLGVVRQ